MFALKLDRFPGAAFRGQKLDGLKWEFALGQDLPHDLADHTRRTDDREIDSHLYSPFPEGRMERKAYLERNLIQRKDTAVTYRFEEVNRGSLNECPWSDQKN